MKEEWRIYKTSKTDIEVSNLGNVRGTKWNGKAFDENIIRIINGRRCIFNHHHPIFILVWTLFNGPKLKKHCIHHIDENKLNDRLDNLQLLTVSEHMRLHETGRKGGNGPMNNKRHSEETKIKIGAASKNRHWYNNGIVSMMIKDGTDIPNGFVLGRIK